MGFAFLLALLIQNQPKEDPADKVERVVRGYIVIGSIGQAAEMLGLEGKRLSAEVRNDLQKHLDVVADEMFDVIKILMERAEAEGDFEQARRELKVFQHNAQGMKRMGAEIQREFERIKTSESSYINEARQKKILEEARRRFNDIQSSIRPLIANGEFTRAIGRLEGARTMAGDNELLVEMILEEIDALKRRVAARKTPPKKKPDPVKKEPVPAKKEPVRPKVATETLVARAIVSLKKRDPDAALKTIDEVMQREPANARALAIRAHAFFLKNNRQNARADAKKAVGISLEVPRAHLIIGLLDFEEGRFADSIRSLTQAISGLPDNAEAYRTRAEASLEMGDAGQALKDLGEASRLDRDMAKEKSFIFSQIIALEDYGNLEAALEELDKWLVMNEGDKDGLLERAGIYFDLERYKEAKAEYSAILKEDPGNEIAKRGKAEATRLSKPASRRRRNRPKASEVKKLLGEHFNASKEVFSIQQDGTVRVTLFYEFNKDDQLADFESRNVKQQRGYADFLGGKSGGAALHFKAPLQGDVTASVQFGFVSDPRSGGEGCALRVTDTDRLDQPGGGVGAALVRGQPWYFDINEYGKLVMSIAQPKGLTITKSQVTTLSIKRSGDAVTGFCSPSLKTEATKPGLSDVSWLRFEGGDSLKLNNVQIQGVLEKKWARKLITPEDQIWERPRRRPKRVQTVTRGELWNGKDLAQFALEGDEPEVRDKAIVVDTGNVSTLIMKKPIPVKNAILEVVVKVDLIYSTPFIGLGVQAGETGMEKENRKFFTFGNPASAGLRYWEFTGEDPGMKESLASKRPLVPGEYMLILKVDGNDLNFVVDEREMYESGKLKTPVFRPVLHFQQVAAEIKSIILK